ncbi:MAG: NADPH-dependent glutamate synthase [Bacillota bacterium]|nr:NADPH-dependent glutamate synthase [Bacillota bacterium]
MPNMSLQKVAMPEQDPDIRNGNFDEVALGYTPENAIEEARRCLGCKNKPCVAGCPVYVQIPEFIKLVEEGKFAEGYEKIRETNNLPAVCGRVCPQETQCEQLCVRAIKGQPVGIGRLERFVADFALANDLVKKPEKPQSKGKKVAVIGSGPAGLTCAADLAKLGYQVMIFEGLQTPGGVLIYGIPEFRLPKELVRREIETLSELGVEIEVNTVVGKTASVEELFNEGYKAVFLGTGAGLPQFLGVEGENLNGVFSANEFLTRVNLMRAYRFPEYDTPIKLGEKVAVVGGGNVAMDAARCAKRIGAKEVYIVYRRSEVELPARVEEVHHAKEEGIIFKLLCNPTKILGDTKGNVCGMECIEMTLGEPDASGRRRPILKPGSEFVLDLQTVIVAIGTTPNPLIKDTIPGLETNRKGCVVADEKTGETSLPGIYAGGDTVTGTATVILAMGAGKNAAEAIDRYLSEKT